VLDPATENLAAIVSEQQWCFLWCHRGSPYSCWTATGPTGS